jgi:hypothetical protein
LSVFHNACFCDHQNYSHPGTGKKDSRSKGKISRQIKEIPAGILNLVNLERMNLHKWRSALTFSLLLSCVSAGLHAQTTQIVYLSGTDKDHPVNWDFFINTGQKSGSWNKIAVPSNWELQGFGTYNYFQDTKNPDEQGLYKYHFSAAISIMDVNLMKDMNMNAVRMSHYPPDQHFLDVCDSLGLFVLDELTGWQNQYDTAVGKKLVKEMVRRWMEYGAGRSV